MNQEENEIPKEDSNEQKTEEQLEEDVQIQKQIDLPFNQEELKRTGLQKIGLMAEFQKSFQQEVQVHETNKKKVLVEWRVFISEVKKEDLKVQLQQLCNQFQRTWQIQNEFLKSLDERLKDANRQYDLTLKNHQLHMDKFQQLRNIKMNSLNKNFLDNLEIIQEEFEQEHTQIVKDRKQQVRRLTDTIQNIKQEEQIKNNIIKENFQQLKEEIKDQTTEEMELMQNEMNTKKVNIYNDLNHLFEKFMKHSKEKFKKYTNLMEMNAQDSKQIEETIKKITKTKNKIKLTSLKIIQMKKEFESKNFKIKKENDEIARNFLALKNKMFEFRDKERKKLTELVTNTKETTLNLKKIYELGESILKNTQLCRKLEFENEKVLPFQNNTQTDDYLDQEIQNNPDLQHLKKFGKFKNILKRYNKVLLDTLAFEKQNKTLKQKNKNLKNQLLKMMDGVTVTKYVLDNKENNLMKTVNKPIYREKPSSIHQPYLEGNLEIMKVNVQNRNQLIIKMRIFL